jgi:orotidine-5'-phosphate decarboxylase
VLARTSNAEGAEVQLAERAGRSVAQAIVDGAAAANRDALAAGAAREQAESGSIAIGDGCGPGIPALGPVGVVVGATADHGLDLSALSGAVLAPGLGAQGATPADLAVRFAAVRGVLLPTASRSVLAAGPSSSAVRTAAAVLRDELAAAQATAH